MILISLITHFSLPAQLSTDTTTVDNWVLCKLENETAYYPGGASAWQKHLKKYIQPLAPPCESGKVLVSFAVLKSGTIDSIQIVKGLCKP